MTNLRPCPFCGGEVSITYISADNVFSIWHKYDGCKFIEPMYIDGKDAKSLSDARNIWNERSVPYLMKEQEAVEPKTGHWIYLQYCANEGVYCSECHTKMFDRYPMKKKLSQFCGNCGAKMEGEVKLE